MIEILVALLTLAVGGLLLSTNHQPDSLPLNVFAAMVLANTYLVRTEPRALSAGPWAIAVAVLTGMCVLPFVVGHGVSLVAAAGESGQADTSPVRLASERGKSMRFDIVRSDVTTETGGPDYVRALNDGLALIRRHTNDSAGVMAIDMVNPFNYLLDRRSPRGGMACAAYNYIFSDTAHPSDGRFFGDARYVVVRKYSRDVDDSAIERYHIEGLYRTYRAGLEARFRLLEETPHWQLYGLRAPGAN